MAIINDAARTTIALFCNSPQEGQVTLYINSSYAFLKYDNKFIYFLFAREEGLEPATNGFGNHYSTNWATPVKI